MVLDVVEVAKVFMNYEPLCMVLDVVEVVVQTVTSSLSYWAQMTMDIVWAIGFFLKFFSLFSTNVFICSF